MTHPFASTLAEPLLGPEDIEQINESPGIGISGSESVKQIVILSFLFTITELSSTSGASLQLLLTIRSIFAKLLHPLLVFVTVTVYVKVPDPVTAAVGALL